MPTIKWCKMQQSFPLSQNAIVKFHACFSGQALYLGFYWILMYAGYKVAMLCSEGNCQASCARWFYQSTICRQIEQIPYTIHDLVWKPEISLLFSSVLPSVWPSLVPCSHLRTFSVCLSPKLLTFKLHLYVLGTQLAYNCIILLLHQLDKQNLFNQNWLWRKSGKISTDSFLNVPTT